MSAFTPVMRDLLIKAIMAGTAVRTAKKTSLGVAYYAAAGVVGFLGLVFFAIAGYGYLQQTYPIHIAAAMTGSVILLLAIAIGLWGHYSLQRKKLIKKPATDGGMFENIESTLKSALGSFEEPIKDNPKMALLMAALAGFAAGDQLGEKMH